MTTIKVTTQVRDRINEFASEHGTTASAVVEQLIREHERSQRFRIMRLQMAGYVPADDARAWLDLGGADLPDEDFGPDAPQPR